MTGLLLYMLKVGIAMGFFYLFYLLLLRGQTRFTLSRFYFIFALLFSLIYPLIELGIVVVAAAPAAEVGGVGQGGVMFYQLDEFIISQRAAESGGVTLWSVGAIVLIGGTLLMLLRLLV